MTRHIMFHKSVLIEEGKTGLVSYVKCTIVTAGLQKGRRTAESSLCVNINK